MYFAFSHELGCFFYKQSSKTSWSSLFRLRAALQKVIPSQIHIQQPDNQPCIQRPTYESA